MQPNYAGWLSYFFTLFESTKLPDSQHKSSQDSPMPWICFFPEQDERISLNMLTYERHKMCANIFK